MGFSMPESLLIPFSVSSDEVVLIFHSVLLLHMDGQEN